LEYLFASTTAGSSLTTVMPPAGWVAADPTVPPRHARPVPGGDMKSRNRVPRKRNRRKGIFSYRKSIGGNPRQKKGEKEIQANNQKNGVLDSITGTKTNPAQKDPRIHPTMFTKYNSPVDCPTPSHRTAWSLTTIGKKEHSEGGTLKRPWDRPTPSLV